MTLTADANDNLLNLVNILSEGWDTTNITLTRSISIKRIMDLDTPTTQQLQSCDYIRVYETAYTEEYIDLGALNVRIDGVYSIDISTSAGFSHLFQLYNEVRRILWSKRKDPTDDSSTRFPFDYIKPISRVDLSDKRRRIQRIVYDVELSERTKVVVTT